MCSLDINPQNDILEVIRLGKKPTGENSGNPGPLKVVMKDKMIKTLMFKKLWKLIRCGRQIPNPQHSERPNEKGKGRTKKTSG